MYEEVSPTIPLLMKSYMDLDNVQVNPHKVEIIPYFKAFIKLFMIKNNRPPSWT